MTITVLIAMKHKHDLQHFNLQGEFWLYITKVERSSITRFEVCQKEGHANQCYLTMWSVLNMTPKNLMKDEN